MKKNQLCVVAVLFVSLSSGAFASLLFESNFDTGYTTGTLNGQAGTNVNTSGNWTYTQADPNPATVTVVNSSAANHDLTYNVSGGGTIAGGSNSLDWIVPSSGSVSGDKAYIDLGTAITGQDFYARVVTRAIARAGGASPGGGASTDLQFTLGDPNGTAPFMGVFNAKGQAGYGGVYYGAATAANSNVDVNSVENVNLNTLIVAKFIWDAGTSKYETVDIWVNPAYGDSGTPLGAGTSAGWGFGSVSRVGLIDFNLTQDTNYAIDSLAVGTTWDDVVPSIPEPSTFALVVVGVGLLAARRRKVGVSA